MIGYIFPTTTKYYNISLPSFDRTPEENKRGNKVLRNIVIRPEADEYTRGVLPSTYDLIIIGDVTFGSVIDVAVKGIELIDSKIAKFGNVVSLERSENGKKISVSTESVCVRSGRQA